MNNRTDQKKQHGKDFMHMLKQVMSIVFCIALLVFSISATDMSTRRMIMLNDDKYALAISLQKDSMLRFDIAGEKLMLNVKPVARIADEVVYNSKYCYETLVKTIRDKMGR